jgi:hypothetical protein
MVLVIGIIVVGLAISVGFLAFNSSAYNSNKSAIATDIQEISTKMMQFWMLPTSMGGANKMSANVTEVSVGASLGFSEVGGVYRFVNDNGEFRILNVDSGVVVIGALGTASKRNKFPYVELTMDLMAESADTELSEMAGF